MTIEQAMQLALQHRQAGQFAEAERIYRQVLTVNPNVIEAYNNLGVLLYDLGRFNEAVFAYQRAIQLNPGSSASYNNLGNALRRVGRFDDAMIAHRHAIVLDPRSDSAHYNLGNALTEQQRLSEAMASYRRSIEIQPEAADAHLSLAHALLLNGDFSEGWEEYEWRLKIRAPSPPPSIPKWDGSPLDGKLILLQAEQGFGDTIQFVRYAPMVASRGGRVVLQCQRQVQRLLQTCAGIEQVIAIGEPMPPSDVHCPMLSLPHLFKTDMKSIPAEIPYIHAVDDLIPQWREKFEAMPKRMRIGITWAGRPNSPGDHFRTINPAQLAPLLRNDRADFFSLQKSAPATGNWIDWTNEIHDFADSAALIANLDLVITVDTAIAHLAGAMGKTVWLMLPFVPDWRWLLGRDESPWYPTMRIFRQRSIGDWPGVIADVIAALRAKLDQSSP